MENDGLKYTEALVRVRGLDVEFNSRKVLSGVDIDVNTGDFLALTGPNGGGKTTLVKAILKLVKPTRGTVEYAPQLTDGRISIGYLPQKNLIDGSYPVTVREVVAMGLLGGAQPSDADERIDRAIARVELESHARHPIGRLSGGQLQRTLLARALVSNPGILVLDEPMSYLDHHSEERVFQLLEEMKGTTTIVVVTHEMSLVTELSTRHVLVDHRARECSKSHAGPVHPICLKRL